MNSKIKFKDTMITVEQKKVNEFIQLVLIDTIGHLIKTGNHYLGFGAQSQAIELIGAIIEDESIERLQSNPKSDFQTTGKSRRRFYNGIKISSNSEYLKYCPELKTDASFDQSYDLYANLRCGYAHQMRPTGKISVTTKKESMLDGTEHLKIDSRTGKLILVSEIFYNDLKEICEKVIGMINNGSINHKKAYDNFLTLTNYSEMNQ